MTDVISEVADPKLGTRLGRFRLDERLGQGGMGVVYRGVDVDSGRPVAVKFLHEALAGIADLVKRFQREVAAMRRLDHPSLIGILDAGVQAGVPYLVMEFFEGRPLSELLERGALKPVRAVKIAQRILAGVAQAHKSGVVHRDLKPDNVLLADGDVVKILDFGLAKLAQEGATQLTNTGLALGTPGYMSPEQARGTPSDERADLYAVGVILYHMVVGNKPFVADSAMAVMRMHMEEPPPPPRQAAPDARLSAALEATILKALEKDPEKRWASAEEMTAALAATLEGGGSLDDVAFEATTLGRKAPRAAAAPAPQAARRARRGARRWLSALLVLALLGAGGVLAWQQLSKRTQARVSAKVDTAVDAAKHALESLRKPGDKKVDAPKVDAPKVDTPKKLDDDPGKLDDDSDEDDPRTVQASDTPGARAEAAAESAKKAVTLADANRLYAAGKTDDAIQALFQLRKRGPRTASLALLLGHAFFKKGWRHDGLREYAQAIQLSPAVKRNATLIHNVVQALDDSTYRAAHWLVRKKLGAAAIPELRRVAKSDKDPTLRKHAAALLKRRK